MEQIKTAFANSFWLRAIPVAAILAPLLIAAMPEEAALFARTRFFYYLPWVLIPVAIGALVGWLAYSRIWFWWTTLGIFTIMLMAVTAPLIILGPAP